MGAESKAGPDKEGEWARGVTGANANGQWRRASHAGSLGEGEEGRGSRGA